MSHDQGTFGEWTDSSGYPPAPPTKHRQMLGVDFEPQRVFEALGFLFNEGMLPLNWGD